ncbi:MAG: PilZ domain-containing protein [Nitrospira sp.]|jgi:c-di-GMP-binding flagellar brake protein YcgR|nr:PilZ domain-containing protein [Candidatus Nitrospira nitrosa]MBK8278095.1 PilZ domain-containing protein [Nitrospira sp.]MBK9947572.1 PilZ domain-containing protein [Nitrospira sp.]
MIGRKQYSPLDKRCAERVAITCRVRYTGEVPTQPHQGEGLTKNISVSGCHVITDQHVTRGTLLTLTIALPDGLPTLSLESALVVWVSGSQFSVRFLDLSRDHRKRIQNFIWKSISHNTVSDQRTRFRLI